MRATPLRFICLVVTAGSLVACGNDTKAADPQVPPARVQTLRGPSTTTHSAPGTQIPALHTARAGACRDLLPYFDQMRALAEQTGTTFNAKQTADDLLEEMREKPEWAAATEYQHKETIAGLRDAAKGHCG